MTPRLLVCAQRALGFSPQGIGKPKDQCPTPRAKSSPRCCSHCIFLSARWHSLTHAPRVAEFEDRMHPENCYFFSPGADCKEKRCSLSWRGCLLKLPLHFPRAACNLPKFSGKTTSTAHVSIPDCMGDAPEPARQLLAPGLAHRAALPQPAQTDLPVPTNSPSRIIKGFC